MNSGCIQATLCEQSKTFQTEANAGSGPAWRAQALEHPGTEVQAGTQQSTGTAATWCLLALPTFFIWNLLSPFTAAKSCSVGNCSWFLLLHSCSRGRWQRPQFINITSIDNTLPQQISARALGPGSSATYQDHCVPSEHRGAPPKWPLHFWQGSQTTGGKMAWNSQQLKLWELLSGCGLFCLFVCGVFWGRCLFVALLVLGFF